MVRALLVDKQCDSARLLDALSPLLQAFFNGLHFSFEGLRGLNQFSRFIRMFSARKCNLPAKFSGSGNQLPHRLFRFLDLIDRPLGHKASARNMISQCRAVVFLRLLRGSS
jgi:hypothetical protein